MIKESLLIGGLLLPLLPKKTGSARMSMGKGSGSNAKMAVEVGSFLDDLITIHNNNSEHRRRWSSPYNSGDIGYKDSLYPVDVLWMSVVASRQIEKPEAINFFVPIRKTATDWYLKCTVDNLIYVVESKYMRSSIFRNESSIYPRIPKDIKGYFVPVLMNWELSGTKVFAMAEYSKESKEKSEEGLDLLLGRIS